MVFTGLMESLFTGTVAANLRLARVAVRPAYQRTIVKLSVTVLDRPAVLLALRVAV